MSSYIFYDFYMAAGLEKKAGSRKKVGVLVVSKSHGEFKDRYVLSEPTKLNRIPKYDAVNVLFKK